VRLRIGHVLRVATLMLFGMPWIGSAFAGDDRHLQLYIVNASNVSLMDPAGRREPCPDSTCRRIPGAESTEQLPLQVPDSPSEKVLRTLLDVPGPVLGEYKLFVRGHGGFTYMQVTGGGTGWNCGAMDVMQTRAGRDYWWSVAVDSGGVDGCMITLRRIDKHGHQAPR
jgi:hypothetical protein